jgi:hypothetical protein
MGFFDDGLGNGALVSTGIAYQRITRTLNREAVEGERNRLQMRLALGCVWDGIHMYRTPFCVIASQALSAQRGRWLA